MCDMQEQGKMEYKWIKSEDNYAEIFTKNLDGTTFNKFAKHFVGDDKYMNTAPIRESVGDWIITVRDRACQDEFGEDLDNLVKVKY